MLDDARGSRMTSRGAPSGEQLALVQHGDAGRTARPPRASGARRRRWSRRCARIARTRPDGVVDLGRVEARQHLVEQQQPRPGRERARQLEELALVQVQPAGSTSALPARPVKSIQCRASSRASARRARAAPKVAASATLSSTRQVRERARDLVGARHAAPGDLVRRRAPMSSRPPSAMRPRSADSGR